MFTAITLSIKIEHGVSFNTDYRVQTPDRMDISYITSCKSDHNVEKRSTDKVGLYFM